jgi:hypothetical protein
MIIESLIAILLYFYLIGVLLIKLSLLFQFLLLPSHYMTKKMLFKGLVIAWIWPIYFLATHFWSTEINEWMHKP